MYRIKPHPGDPSAERLLKPAAALGRLRAIKLAVIQRDLETWCYRARSAELGQRFAPHLTAQWSLVSDWDDWFNAILRTVEATYPFEIDWGLLDADYQAWMDDEDEYQETFARWLWELPVQRYGFSNWDESWPEHYPAMALVKALVDDDWGDDILAYLAESYDLSIDGDVLLADIRYRLSYPALFEQLDPPLCWLPEMEALALGTTGNPLLDSSNYYEDDPPSYTWEQVEEVAELYRQAEPTLVKMREFLGWGTGYAEMQAIVDALVGEPQKRKRRRVRLKNG